MAETTPPWSISEMKELLVLATALGFKDDIEYFKKELAKAGK